MPLTFACPAPLLVIKLCPEKCTTEQLEGWLLVHRLPGPHDPAMPNPVLVVSSSTT
jgi:hypothetical protein